MGIFVSRPDTISSIIFCALSGVESFLAFVQDKPPNTNTIPDIKTKPKPNQYAFNNIVPFIFLYSNLFKHRRIEIRLINIVFQNSIY